MASDEIEVVDVLGFEITAGPALVQEPLPLLGATAERVAVVEQTI